MYPEKITQKEKEFGFVLIEAKTEYENMIGGGHQTMKMVIKKKTRQDRILKTDENAYQLQFLLQGKDPDFITSWHPTEDRTYTLDEIDAA